MKFKHLILGVILAFGLGAVAQSTMDTRENPKVGVKVGGNLSNVWDENQGDFEANSKLGFMAGVSASIPIGPYLGVQPSVLFSQKGFKDQGSFLGSSYSFTRTTNYLDVPVLLEFKPTPYLTIVGGPQYSYLMSREDHFTSGSLSGTDFDRYENNNIRKNTLGALFGFDVNVNQWVFSPRAGWDLQSNNGDGSSSSLRYKNQWVQLGVGYYF